MILSGAQIRARLEDGSLGWGSLPDVTPDVGPFSLGLRLGTEFREMRAALRQPFAFDPLAASSDALQFDSSRILPGERLLLVPGAYIVGTTLEFLKMPRDLAGFLFGKTFCGRLGLMVAPGMVSPGFQGRLVISMANLGVVPIALYPAAIVAQLAFAQMAGDGSEAAFAMYESFRPADHASEAIPEKILGQWKEELLKARPSEGIRTSWEAFLVAPVSGKGAALEDLAGVVLSSISGLAVMRRDARLRAEEIDLVVKNDRQHGFWRFAGSPILVECKNWKGKVGAAEITVLTGKMRAVSRDVHVGILFAPECVTGSRANDGWLKIREARQDGLYVLVLDRSDLERIVAGEPAEVAIERTYDDLLFL